MNLKGMHLVLIFSIFVAWVSIKVKDNDSLQLWRFTGKDLGKTQSTPAYKSHKEHYSHHNTHHRSHHNTHHHSHHNTHHHSHNHSNHKHDKYDINCENIPQKFPPDTDTVSILCVDQRGCCNFTTVQSAIDAVANMSAKRTIIWINKGIYREKVIIPKIKPNITFQGQGMQTTAISWNDTANSSGGTFNSASVSVFSDNFIAKNISFMNAAPIPKPGAVGAQGVAIRVGGDQAAFWGCGFCGAQDTLHDDKGKHYFKECHIQGSIDFIFGDGRSLYENCRLISIAAPNIRYINGAVTANGRKTEDDDTGFSFVGCTIDGTGTILLGRAWKAYARVVFAYTYMSNIISPEGWNDINDPSKDKTIFFGEYKCSGPGSNLSQRAPYVHKLDDIEASIYLNTSYIDGDSWIQPFA